MLERDYQSGLIKKIKRRFPGCFILKNDTGYMQGIPDLTIFYGNKWATLEVKPYATAPLQPNQDYYVDLLDGMSFAAFIYPENEEEILHGLQQLFKPHR